MSIFRFATFAALVALMFPLGSSSATTTSSSVPGSLADSPALDLRTVGSRLVVETIEDALRQGGLALFDEGFQLDSSLSWVFGETIEGEVDAVVPLWNRDGHVVFAQPGFVFWTGLEEEERTDGNLGFVYRTRLANTPLGFDAVGGASVFYDYDFKNGHGRAGFGADIQSGFFHGAFNYYHPLTGTQDGREGFVEDALRGMDFRVALEREAMRVGANLGYWRFEGDEEAKGDWRSSYGFDAGIRIVPGVFLEGGWERHDETASFDRRWNAGLAFRFSLPGFEGASYGDGGLSSNLWKLVKREKRILYEERLGIPRVSLSATQRGPVAEPMTAGENETVTVEADLGKPLDEDIMLHVMVVDETSTATLGTDFTYGHRVYELDGATGEQSAPEGDAMPCPEDLATACEVMIPAGVTRFDIEANIAMTTEREVREFIDFQIEVPEEYSDLLRGSVVERVAIEAHGNEIGFATDAVATLAEDNEMTGVEVSVSIDRPSPAPITLNVATSGTATVNEDYRINTTTLRIPANASSASLTLWGINNNRGEGSKSIVLTISGNLPEGWTITDDEHTVTLQDDDLSIFFTGATTSRVDEPGTGSNADVTVSLGITQAPTANITVRVAAGGTGETATPGSSMDYTFTGMDFTFPADSTAPQTATFSVHPDNVAEEDEFIVLTLADDSTNSRDAEGSGFSLGSPHTITIPANDNTVGFASSSATTLAENNTTTGVAVRVEVVEPAPTQITLSVAPTGTATVNEDYMISARSLIIPANTRMSDSLTLWGIDNRRSEGSKQIVLTFTGNLPAGWDFASDPFTRTITLQDDDLSVGFAEPSGTVDEPGTDTDHTVNIEITQEPADDITLQIMRASASTADTTGSNIDVAFSPSTVTFTSSDFGPKTVTLNVKADTIPEGAEFIELELGDSGNTRTSNGNMFSFGRQTYRLNINANDNIVSIDSMSASTLTEDGTANIVVSVDKPSPADITLNVEVTSSSTPAAVAGTDYNVPSTLLIPADSSTGTLTVTGIDDNLEQGQLMLDFELTGTLPAGWAFSSGASSLTHQMTITDNETSRIGWAQTEIELPKPAPGDSTADKTHTIPINAEKFPSGTGTISIAHDSASTTTAEVDYFVASLPTGCGLIRYTTGQTGNTSCQIFLGNGIDVGDTIILTISPNNLAMAQLATDNIVISPATITIRIVEAPIVFIDSTSVSTLDENGGTANVVVKANNLPEGITLNVTTGGTAEKGSTKDYTISSETLTFSAGTSSETLTLTGVDDATRESTPLTIDLGFTGTLPNGWRLAPDPLTHTVTITDDEKSVGWTDAAITHTNTQVGSEMLTLMVKLSESVNEAIRLNINPNLGTAKSESGVGSPSDDFTVALDRGVSQCGSRAPNFWVEFPANATGNDLTQRCVILIRDSAVTKSIIMELSDANANLGSLKTVIDPSRVEIMVVNP